MQSLFFLACLPSCYMRVSVHSNVHNCPPLVSLKEDAEAAGEGYKYDTLEAVYIKGKTYEDIVRETGCGRNSPKKWCKVMIQRLSIKLFGAKAIENDKNGVKTG